MNAMKNKIQSQKGASITFALLLFLVCAVISGVVIVAATAAAGRMSEQADMDERYYAVTAVANRLKTVMENGGNAVKLRYTKADKPENISDIEIIDPEGLTGLLATASKDVLTRTATEIPVNSGVAIENADKSVKCAVTGKLAADGTLVFEIEATTAKNKRTYHLTQTFGSTLKNTATDSAEAKATATVKWEMLSVKKWRNDEAKKAEG